MAEWTRTELGSSMPSCVGLCAHIELARISGYIVRETYGIAPQYTRAANSEASIDVALGMLHEWHSRLPADLLIPSDQTLLDPACCTLHMYYNQLILLTTRPVFFAATKKIVAQRMFSELSSSEGHVLETHLRSCTEAAQRNLELARLLQSRDRNWLQSGLHFLFNAAVVLLLSRISSAYEDNGDTDRANEGPHDAEIRFAIQVFEQETKTGTNYPRDCCRVLQDLNALTDRYVLMQRIPDTQQRAIARKANTSTSQLATDASVPVQVSSRRFNDDPGIYQEMMAWAQLDGLQLQDTLLI